MLPYLQCRLLEIYLGICKRNCDWHEVYLPRHSETVGDWISVLAAIGCRPRNQNMLLAYVRGDIFLPDLRRGNWNVGETTRCQIASRTSTAPDSRGDLLLCGAETQGAWSQTWLRSDIKPQIYNAATEQAVRFHSIGHSGGRFGPDWWQCRKTPEGINCE
jgi:hypothetical protein